MGLQNLPDVMNAIFDRRMSEIHTCLPAKVIKYEFETQKATVQPLIKKDYLDGTKESLPIIVNVPVVWPRTAKASFTFPLEEDDYVMLLFSERAMELFLDKGGEQLPGDRRQFDLIDAIAVPGLFPFNVPSLSTNNDDVLLIYKYSSFRIKKDGKMVITASEVTINGELKVTGDCVVGFGTHPISSKTHIHSGVTTGPGNTGAPV